MLNGTRPIMHEITKLQFVDSGTQYNDMVYRPYATNASDMSMLKLNEVTEGGRFLDPNLLANITSEIIAPKTQHDGVINVQGGWGGKRLAFNMIVKSRTMIAGANNEVFYYISGYTDNGEYHTNGLETIYNPNMVMTVNNILQLGMENVPGIGLRPKLQDASRLISGNSQFTYSPNYGGELKGDITLRPQDIINKIDTMCVQDVNKRGRIVHSDDVFTDVKVSRLSNDNPSMYLSSTLSAIAGSYQNAGEYDDINKIMSRARNQVLETGIKTDPFLHSLRNYENDFFKTGSFTFGSLQRMQPGLDAFVEHFTGGRVQREHDPLAMQGNMGGSSDWTGGDPATMAATILVQSMPALMSEFLLQGVSFSVTNAGNIGGLKIPCSRGGNFTYIPHRLATLGGWDASPISNRFAEALVNRLVYDLTVQNQRSVELHGTFSLATGENRIKIRLGGGHEYIFTSPSFMNSTYSPVMGKNMMTLDSAAKDFNSMSDAICTDFSPITQNATKQFDGRNPQRFELHDNFNSGAIANVTGFSTPTKSIL